MNIAIEFRKASFCFLGWSSKLVSETCKTLIPSCASDRWNSTMHKFLNPTSTLQPKLISFFLCRCSLLLASPRLSSLLSQFSLPLPFSPVRPRLDVHAVKLTGLPATIYAVLLE